MKMLYIVLISVFLSFPGFSQVPTTPFFLEEDLVNLVADEFGGMIQHNMLINAFSASFLQRKGVALLNQDNITEAFHLFKLSHDIALKIKDELSLARAYNNIGFVYYHQIKIDESLQYYQSAIKILEQKGSESEVAVCSKNIGEIYFLTGQLEEALDWYLKTKEIQERLKIINELPTTYHNLGKIYFSFGLFDEALKNYLLAKEKANKLGFQKFYAVALGSIGLLYHTKGQYNEAYNWYSKAHEIQKSLKYNSDLAFTYDYLGNNYFAQGQYDQALNWLNKSKDIREGLGHKGNLATSFNNIAVAYEAQGQYQEALQWFKKSKKLLNELGLKPQLATAYNNIGRIYYVRGQNKEALEWYQRAKTIREELDDPVDLANSYNNIGSVYSEQKKYEEALFWFEKTANIQKEIGAEVFLAISYDNIGGLFSSQKQFDKALIWYSKAKEIRKRLGLQVDLIASYNNLAILYFDQEKPDSALYYAQQNLQISSQLRGFNFANRSRKLFVDKSLEAIEVGINSAYDLEQEGMAFNFSEKGKGRNLIDLLVERPVIQSSQSTTLSLSEINDQMNAVQQGLAQHIDMKKRKYLIQQRDSLFRERNLLEDEIKRNSPKYAHLIYPETVDENQIQTILQRDEILISFFTGTHQTFAFLITPNDLKVIDLGDSDSLKTAINSLRNNYVSKQKKSILQNNQLQNKRLNQTFFQISHLLYQKLWRPLEETGLLKNRKIILVKDGFLNYLPFELLIKDQEQKVYSNYQYLVKDYPISYYPSATVFHFERTKKEQSKNWSKDFLGIAQSDFSNNFCYEDNTIFPSLPFTIPEVKGIAKQFKHNRTTTLWNETANEATFKNLTLTDYRYLHFSTHGLINMDQLDFSRILLSSSDQEDGCLNLYEIFNLKLNADLVTLSVCETGLGQLVRGEGMVGFTRALMYAGTPSIILSLWEVADESTSELFVKYYSTLQANGGKNKYKPLREVQLEMIQSEDYSNPYYWAPFVFIGAK